MEKAPEYQLIEIQSGPLSDPDEIEEELDAVKRLPETPERATAIAKLESLLKDAQEIHGNED